MLDKPYIIQENTFITWTNHPFVNELITVVFVPSWEKRQINLSTLISMLEENPFNATLGEWIVKNKPSKRSCFNFRYNMNLPLSDFKQIWGRILPTTYINCLSEPIGNELNISFHNNSDFDLALYPWIKYTFPVTKIEPYIKDILLFLNHQCESGIIPISDGSFFENIEDEMNFLTLLSTNHG